MGIHADDLSDLGPGSHHVAATMSPGRLTALYVNGVRQPLPEDD